MSLFSSEFKLVQMDGTLATVSGYGSSGDAEEGSTAAKDRAPFSGFAIGASYCLSLPSFLIYGQGSSCFPFFPHMVKALLV